MGTFNVQRFCCLSAYLLLHYIIIYTATSTVTASPNAGISMILMVLKEAKYNKICQKCNGTKLDRLLSSKGFFIGNLLFVTIYTEFAGYRGRTEYVSKPRISENENFGK